MTTTTGTKVNYWPDRLPFLGNQSYPAEVVALGADKACRLRVSNPNTKRDFFAWAVESEGPAPGAFTVPKVEPAKPAAPPVAPSVAVSVSGDKSK